MAVFASHLVAIQKKKKLLRNGPAIKSGIPNTTDARDEIGTQDIHACLTSAYPLRYRAPPTTRERGKKREVVVRSMAVGSKTSLNTNSMNTADQSGETARA